MDIFIATKAEQVIIEKLDKILKILEENQLEKRLEKVEEKVYQLEEYGNFID